jgi:hypothetical protein
MKRFVCAVTSLMFSGLVIAGSDVPVICNTPDMPNVFNAVDAMKSHGALPDKNYANKDIEVRTLDRSTSCRTGLEP